MNDELRSRGLELNTSNSFFESVLAEPALRVVVLDRDLACRRGTPKLRTCGGCGRRKRSATTSGSTSDCRCSRCTVR